MRARVINEVTHSKVAVIPSINTEYKAKGKNIKISWDLINGQSLAKVFTPEREIFLLLLLYPYNNDEISFLLLEFKRNSCGNMWIEKGMINEQ